MTFISPAGEKKIDDDDYGNELLPVVMERRHLYL